MDSKKLKMLCLHGQNGDKNLMEYQIRHLKACFSQVMEFTTIDGTYDCPQDPPASLAKFLVDGRTNFREWLKLPFFSPKEGVPDKSAYGLEDSVTYLKQILSSNQYDGVIAFSQGGIFYRHFWRIT